MLAVTVDTVINNSESDNVILTLTGVDDDAAIVTVTLTGADGGQVTANAEAGNNGDWIANVSGGTLADGYVAVSVNVTDDWKYSFDVDWLWLDTTADELDIFRSQSELLSESPGLNWSLLPCPVLTEMLMLRWVWW